MKFIILFFVSNAVRFLHWWEGAPKLQCIVCHYPQGNSVCSDRCRHEHQNRERHSQSIASWKDYESNPESKAAMMKMTGYTEEDYNEGKKRYLG